MPKFLEKKLKQEYGAKSDIPYKVMNAKGYMHGNKTTAKGEALQAKHEKDTKMAHKGKSMPDGMKNEHYDKHLGHHGGGHGEVDGHDGHKGHDGIGGMPHMTTKNMKPQNAKHLGKHGGLMGQHPAGGTLSGNHSYHNIKHTDHHSKMTEG